MAKRDFLGAMDRHVLAPNDYVYKMQFCGPTGANAVEAALKIARKATGRTGIFSFMGGYHGMSLGSLSATGNRYHRGGSGIPLQGVSFMPYPHGLSHLRLHRLHRAVLEDEPPLTPGGHIFKTGDALIVLTALDTSSRRRGQTATTLLLICDALVRVADDSVSSFERAGITPDIVRAQKSIALWTSGCARLVDACARSLDAGKSTTARFRGNQWLVAVLRAGV